LLLSWEKGYSVAGEKADLFRELLKMGNEIGVHTHVSYDNLPTQDEFIVPDADALENLELMSSTSFGTLKTSGVLTMLGTRKRLASPKR